MTSVLTLLMLAQTPVQGRPVSEGLSTPVLPRTGDPAVLGAINGADANMIEAAKLASTKGSAAEVKSFASSVVREHQASLTEGSRLAKARHIDRVPPVDPTLTQAHTQAMHELNLLSGSAFDARFMRLMADEHRAALTLLDGGLGASTSDPECKQFVGKQLPLLRSHRATAEKWLAAHVPAPPRSP